MVAQMQTKKVGPSMGNHSRKFLKLQETLVRQLLLAKAVTRQLIETIRRQTDRIIGSFNDYNRKILLNKTRGLWDSLNFMET